jgi:hypothetical protein
LVNNAYGSTGLPDKTASNSYAPLILYVQDASAPSLITNVKVAGFIDSSISFDGKGSHVTGRQAHRIEAVHPNICARIEHCRASPLMKLVRRDRVSERECARAGLGQNASLKARRIGQRVVREVKGGTDVKLRRNRLRRRIVDYYGATVHTK